MLGSIRHLKNLICCEVALNSRSLTSSIVLRALLISDSLLIQDASARSSEFQWNQTSMIVQVKRRWALAFCMHRPSHPFSTARLLGADCSVSSIVGFDWVQSLTPDRPLDISRAKFRLWLLILSNWLLMNGETFKSAKKTLCLNENSLWSNEKQLFSKGRIGNKSFFKLFSFGSKSQHFAGSLILSRMINMLLKLRILFYSITGSAHKAWFTEMFFFGEVCYIHTRARQLKLHSVSTKASAI